MNPASPVPAADGFWTTRRFLLVLTAVVLAVFPKVVLGLTTFFFRDFGALGYPGAFYFQQSLFHGELPLWDPYSHCGVPYLAQMGQWYPPNWLFLLLPLPWSANVSMLAHLMLGGWGTHALARRWGADGFAASFAGMAYAFSGVSLSCFQWSNYIASLGWLPWVVLAATEAWRQGGRWIAIAAVVSALQVLTATPEFSPRCGWRNCSPAKFNSGSRHAAWRWSSCSRQVSRWCKCCRSSTCWRIRSAAPITNSRAGPCQAGAGRTSWCRCSTAIFHRRATGFNTIRIS